MKIVLAVLCLLGGLRLLSSPMFNSLLALRFDGQMDYRWMPGIGLLVFATAVCVAKILANSRQANNQPPSPEPRRPAEEEFSQQRQESHERRSRESDWR